MVWVVSRGPIKTLYNYPPAIQERVKSLDAYKGQIPTDGNKASAKIGASLIFVIVLSLVLRLVNGCATFASAFVTGFVLWTAVNLYDAVVLDIIWFCHDPHFVLEGTEDMIDAYHDYGFHMRGFLIGEGLGLIVCLLAGLIVSFVQ